MLSKLGSRLLSDPKQPVRSMRGETRVFVVVTVGTQEWATLRR